MARIAWLLPLVLLACGEVPSDIGAQSNGFKLPGPKPDITWVTKNGGPTKVLQERVWISVGEGRVATIIFPGDGKMGVLAGGILLLSDAMIQGRTVRAPVTFAHPDPEIVPEFQVNTFYYPVPVPPNGVVQVDFLEGSRIRGHVELAGETLMFEAIPLVSCSPKMPDIIEPAWDPYATEYCRGFRWLLAEIPAPQPVGPPEDVIVNTPGACGGVDYRRICDAPPPPPSEGEDDPMRPW